MVCGISRSTALGRDAFKTVKEYVAGRRHEVTRIYVTPGKTACRDPPACRDIEVVRVKLPSAMTNRLASVSGREEDEIWNMVFNSFREEVLLKLTLLISIIDQEHCNNDRPASSRACPIRSDLRQSCHTSSKMDAEQRELSVILR